MDTATTRDGGVWAGAEKANAAIKRNETIRTHLHYRPFGCNSAVTLLERDCCKLASMDELKIESIPGTREGVRIIRLNGPFVLQGMFEFQSVARSGHEPVTIIDLTDVPFMDSAALGAVMGLHVSCQRQQRKYGLVGASGRLRTLFEVAGVAAILVNFRTIEEAEEKLTASAAAK
jgi:anti-sigma B factor antagonist